jgi:hypothetical protein
MKRRAFLQYGSLATMGIIAGPSLMGSPEDVIIDNRTIKKVHLIFKTHLDIGFTNLAANVINIYMNEFIPGALSLAENLRNKGTENRFVWTTGSWLINQFLEKSEHSMRMRMEKAIENGDIVWHGLPFTMHSELVDSSLYDLGIQLSVNLDKRFGKKTIAAKMTDVPGHTRGVVPVLAKNDISLLHIGVNPASRPPDVPPLFVWRAPDGTEIVVMYQKEYGSQMILPGTQTAVAICFTNDNHGPQKPEEIAKIYSDLHKQYPNAEVIASTLNIIADEISTIRKQLPVVTQELGDTWIHGVGSDPLKVARFREMSRLRKKCLEDKTIQFGDTTDLAFGIPLLMVAEHTWGLDVKKSLGDYNIYKPEDFKIARSKSNFRLMEQSWEEKREYINDSIAQLPDEKAFEAKEKIEALKPVPVNKAHFSKIENHHIELDTQFYELKINPETGGIVKFKDKASGFDWAKPDHPLCQFSYQTFSKPDFDRFQNQYLTNKFLWALQDFGKEGIETAHPVSGTWMPVLKESYLKKDNQGYTILLELAVTDNSGKLIGGSPEQISIELYLPSKKKELQVTLQWFNKPAYRLPEASWFSFIPPVKNGHWILNKMGQPVNSEDVVKDGNRKLHAINYDVRFENSSNHCFIESMDAPLIAPGERTLLNFDNKLPEADQGVHFCLHNNVWGTNFMMWFEDDMKYRFVFKT